MLIRLLANTSFRKSIWRSIYMEKGSSFVWLLINLERLLMAHLHDQFCGYFLLVISSIGKSIWRSIYTFGFVVIFCLTLLFLETSLSSIYMPNLLAQLDFSSSWGSVWSSIYMINFTFVLCLSFHYLKKCFGGPFRWAILQSFCLTSHDFETAL